MAALIAAGVHMLNVRQQRRRIALLAQHLSQFQIEKLMENLLEGYLRALGEKEEARRDQIWQLLRTTELQLAEQFQRFAADFAKVEPQKARVSRLPVALP